MSAVLDSRNDGEEVWPRIKEQLSKPEWNYRTTRGLAKATHISESAIREAISQHINEVRIAHSEKYPGEELYTLKEREPTSFELLSVIRKMIAG